MATINSLKFKITKRGALIGGFLLLAVIVLAACGILVFGNRDSVEQKPQQVIGAILPHHLLVQGFIDEFYGVLAAKIQPERIILISPNHFNYGVRYIQSTTVTPETEYDNLLDLEAIRFLAIKGAAAIENKFYGKEHGVFVHYPFIQKYFPDAKIVPLIIKGGTPPANLDQLIQILGGLDAKKTLVLASVDFTHYVDDGIALTNDQRTIAYFEKWSKDALLQDFPTRVLGDLRELAKTQKQNYPEAVAIDSPETLAVLLNYLHMEGVHGFKLWKRSSTQSFIHVADPDSNTSHIFAVFE